MKNRPIKITIISMFVLVSMLTLAACATQTPTPTAQPASSATSTESVSDETATTAPTAEPVIESTFTATSESATATQTGTATLAGPTETITPTMTTTQVAGATATETLGQMLKTHIVFYLIIPGDPKHRDACGTFRVEPIISKRLVTGDKVQDFVIALNMLFSVGSKYWGAYYNALWDTHFTIDSYEYRAKTDYIIVKFGGDFPYTRLTSCDKHGIREQIWTTWRHYGFKEKTFMVSDGYLIDRLGGD